MLNLLARSLKARSIISISNIIGVRRKMFIQVFDPFSNEMVWKVEDDDYDLAQEIARSSFADMLHDSERNRLYKKAIQNVVEEMKRKGKKANVVDIGTGTGLLSLFAAQAGADHVTAIEMFKPMVDCAKKVIELNKFNERIEVISSRSTDIEPGSVGRGNIIVAEVFDTELIGEGALRVFKEAPDVLVEDEYRVIPSSGKVWVLPVSSDFLQSFNKPPNKLIKNPFVDCAGCASVFDLQLSEVEIDKINVLSAPFVAFRFDFEKSNSYNFEESSINEVRIKTNRACELHAILMWWELDMDGSGKNILSTAPKWIKSDAKWRDHWMQAVYYLPQPRIVNNDDLIYLRCEHDEFSFWFDLQDDHVRESKKSLPHVCTCKLHALCSRNALYRMNELDSNLSFLEMLKEQCCSKNIFCINSGSVLGVMCAKFAKHVCIYEPNLHFHSIIRGYCENNNITNFTIVSSEETLNCTQFDLILSEPFFNFSMLPWNNLRFWRIVENMFIDNKRNSVKILPICGIMKAMPVQLEDLWKIAAPIEVLENIDLSPFDELQRKARSAVDAIIEPHPLWEYPSVCTGETFTIAKFDFSDEFPRKDLVFLRTINPTRSGTNAIILWMEWDFGATRLSGLDVSCAVGEKPNWNIGQKQGVYFFPIDKIKQNSIVNTTVEATFSPSDGNTMFRFCFSLN